MSQTVDRRSDDVGTRVEAWVAEFADALSARDVDRVLGLFTDDCYWRDLVAFT